jgi:hypothetical protein
MKAKEIIELLQANPDADVTVSVWTDMGQMPLVILPAHGACKHGQDVTLVMRLAEGYTISKRNVLDIPLNEMGTQYSMLLSLKEMVEVFKQAGIDSYRERYDKAMRIIAIAEHEMQSA